MIAAYPAVAILGLLVAGCGSGPRTVTLKSEGSSQATVVRDHPLGAEVVESSRYKGGQLVIEVDGTPVRSAAHLRSLLSAAEENEDGYMVVSVPPEGRAVWQQNRDRNKQ